MSLENLDDTARDALASLTQMLSENPSTRKEFLRLTKKVKPEMAIPEIDIEETIEKSHHATDRRVQELEAKLREKDALDDLNSRRQKVIKRGLAKEDDIPEIEKVMLEKKIADHEAAAEY